MRIICEYKKVFPMPAHTLCTQSIPTNQEMSSARKAEIDVSFLEPDSKHGNGKPGLQFEVTTEGKKKTTQVYSDNPPSVLGLVKELINRGYEFIDIYVDYTSDTRQQTLIAEVEKIPEVKIWRSLTPSLDDNVIDDLRSKALN